MARKIPKFSVIIPAHNAASHGYFLRCLDSIVQQSYKDYELIVVADNCVDNTVQVATDYNAKVIVTCVGNDGFARNIGLDHARGEWVLFLDDDDWWMHNRVLELLAGRLTDEVDVLQFGFYWNHVGYCMLLNGKLPVNVWSKCWRRSFIGSTRVTERIYPAADKALTDAIFAKHPRIALWDTPFYFYNYMRIGSITEKEKHGNK